MCYSYVHTNEYYCYHLKTTYQVAPIISLRTNNRVNFPPAYAKVNESYHESGLLGQLDRQMTDWLVLGSLGMTGTNDCSHEMTESLMADLDMF